MLKKTITYMDFNDNERTEDFYFNLNKLELIDMQLSEEGGLEEYIKRIYSKQDYKQIVELFQTIICKAYGEKSPDGKRFEKSPEILKAFTQTLAYEELFIELSTSTEVAAAFVNGIVPKMK